MLDNTRIVITGAAGTLGQATAGLAAARGAHVIGLDVVAADGVPNVAEYHRVDLLDGGQTTSCIHGIGPFDALVNIAGGFQWETLADGDVGTWDQLYAMNLRTAVVSCMAALPAMREQGRGRIVNISAAAAAERADSGMGAYTASKAGVLKLTESLARELKDEGITVNAILPGIIDTPRNRADMPDADFDRWVSPAAIANVIEFLVSDAASAVTGAAIPVVGRG